MNAGRIAVLGYVLAFLIVPMVGIAILGQPDDSIYHFTAPGWLAFGAVLLILAACWTPLFSSRWVNFPAPCAPRWASTAAAFLQRNVLWLSLVQLIFFVLLFPPELADYRYRDGGISALGPAFFSSIALKSAALVFLLWLLAEYVRDPEREHLGYRLSVFVLTALFIYGASGTGDIFTASFFLLLGISPQWFVRIITIEAGTTLFTLRNIPKNLAVAVIAVQAYVSLPIGENIKEGVATPIESIGLVIAEAVDGLFDSDSGIETASTPPPVAEPPAAAQPPASVGEAAAAEGAWFVLRLLEGTASQYYSLMQFFDGYAEKSLQNYNYPLQYPLTALSYRLGVLLGNAAVAPEIQSISRLNFIILTLHPIARAGTSPGAVASFAYILPLPIAIVAGIAFLALIGALINMMFWSDGRRFSLMGGIVLMIPLQVFFQSPLDLLIVFDNAFVFAGAFVVLAFLSWASRSRRPAPEADPQLATSWSALSGGRP